MSIRARRIAQTHKILGLVIGLQLLFWTISGLFFTLFPIETIRGEHLQKAPAALNFSGVETLAAPGLSGMAGSAELRQLSGQLVWEVHASGEAALYDAQSGERIPPLGEAAIRELAEVRWAGDGKVSAVERVAVPPREAFSDKPLWRVRFDGTDTATFWVDGDVGRVVTVRTAKWRVFDVLWRFHIMDVTGKDRFDTWWLKLAAFLGLSTVLFGLALLVQRILKGRLLK